MSPKLDLGKFAESLGWAKAGVSEPEIRPESLRHYDEWLKHYKGAGLEYMERRKLERQSPKAYFPNVRSILCFGLYYFPGWAAGPLKVSNYSWGQDYHEVLKTKLEQTVLELIKVLGAFEYRICVDTSPVLEKVLAAQAGLGWQGKNSLVLNQEYGSFLFLGEIFTDIALETFQATLNATNRCGTCERCIVACPTGALEDSVLKTELCISYWTLEHRGAFTAKTPKWNNWIAGCDICQEVCPWNQDLIPLEGVSRLEISEEDIRLGGIHERVKDSALSYVPKDAWLRNLEHVSQETGKKTEIF